MTLDEIAIAVDDQGHVSVDAPPQYGALVALLQDDLGIEGSDLYTVLARLYGREEQPWKVTGDSCTLTVQGDRAEIVNDFNDNRAEMTREDLLEVLERLRDEMAYARARRRSGES